MRCCAGAGRRDDPAEADGRHRRRQNPTDASRVFHDVQPRVVSFRTKSPQEKSAGKAGRQLYAQNRIVELDGGACGKFSTFCPNVQETARQRRGYRTSGKPAPVRS